MKFSVRYHRRVELDFAEAKFFYKTKKASLEVVFAREVERAIHQIINDSLLFQRGYKNVRIAYTKLFPFGIHYYRNERERFLAIIAVFHTSMNPKDWEERQ